MRATLAGCHPFWLGAPMGPLVIGVFRSWAVGCGCVWGGEGHLCHVGLYDGCQPITRYQKSGIGWARNETGIYPVPYELDVLPFHFLQQKQMLATSWEDAFFLF